MYPINQVGIPDYIQRQLDGPPPGHPGRHEAWEKLSLQTVGERIPDDIIFDLLRNWIPDPDKTDKELRNLINGAHMRSPQPASGSVNGRRLDYPQRPVASIKVKAKPIKPSESPATNELPSIACTWTEFLRRAYYPGEKIFLATEAEWNGKKWTPEGDTQEATLEQWLTYDGQEAPGEFNPKAGAWIAINPFKEWEHKVDGKYAGKRVQDNVSAFRYVMFESDTRTKAQQFEDIKASGLPVAFVIDSGGDSLHAWVRVDAKDVEEWRARRDVIYETMRDCGVDGQNKDVSRLSRLPGVPRGESFQGLVAENNRREVMGRVGSCCRVRRRFTGGH
jgi:hypothetical protein